MSPAPWHLGHTIFLPPLVFNNSPYTFTVFGSSLIHYRLRDKRDGGKTYEKSFNFLFIC